MNKEVEDLFSALTEPEKMNINLIAQVITKMKEQGMSQRELSRRTGLKQSTLSRQFRFEVTMNVESLMKISEQLGVEPVLLTKEEIELVNNHREEKLKVKN